MDILDKIGNIEYKGKDSKDIYSFKYYNRNEIINGKKMKDHLKFAMSYWHTLGQEGIDPFGKPTIDKSFGKTNPMDIYKAKAEFGFKLMDKLGLEYFCFHDVDVAPEGNNLKETFENLDVMVDYINNLKNKYHKKLLWGTANNFSDKMFMSGAATSFNPDVFTVAAAKVKKAIDATIKLDGTGYVFWGGREGYDTLLNTNLGLEQDNLARFLRLAIDYGRKQGFKGDFYIEPKPKEPTVHQYDFDVATTLAFLRKYDLINDVKVNIEANHATLAGHTFQHEIRVARENNIFGSIDANEGDLLLGWDVDRFPSNVYDSTMAMYEILKAGGFTNGGLNFDAKSRRASNTLEDIVLSYILGMDTYALGLRLATKIIEDGRLDKFVSDRYKNYNNGIGKKIIDNNTTLEDLYDYAINLKEINVDSGREEMLLSIINNIIYNNL